MLIAKLGKICRTDNSLYQKNGIYRWQDENNINDPLHREP